eukprot:CAMPEP_0195515508 /NCGR_PEP_ID=MMETSP0794_2-20130614/6550_1 /TAXON_ID=515487 /ORGANISM="Stephanopyxis turris, Strain CCMP 815" /LENGTH=536 /DNA_ID=CAMNT_0040643939 /DNA_START=13 /DNA_END=1624 /DNA_ORIENTATION=+
MTVAIGNILRDHLFGGVAIMQIGTIPVQKVKDDGSEKEDAEKDSETAAETRSIRGSAGTIAKEQENVYESTHAILQQFFESSSITNNKASLSLELKTEIETLTSTPTFQQFLSTTRRSLHRHPELMYQESHTSETIQTILTELNIPYSTGWAKNTHEDAYPGTGGYGIVAHIGTQSEGDPCIILRADMDALPIAESTPYIESYKSRSAGKMHACGHDGHVTMLLGAAALLKGMEASIARGTVRLVFQPAEEGGAGGKRMVEEGVIRMSPAARAAFGMHVWPALPTGAIASAKGALLAAAETYEVVVQGVGGHAAMPHQTIDPVVASSALVMSLQHIVSRGISPLESGVVSVTQISAGDGAFNVIPSKAVIRGTVRALSTEMLMDLRERVKHVAEATSLVYGCNATVTFSPDYYPPTVNDGDLFDYFSKDVGALVSKDGYVRDIEPTMGGEDFAFLAEKIPSTFFLIGQGSGGDNASHLPDTDYGLHHPSFALDEHVLPIGVQLHVNLAIRSLKALSDGGSDWKNMGSGDPTVVSEL